MKGQCFGSFDILKEEHTSFGEIEAFFEQIRNKAEECNVSSQCGTHKVEIVESKGWHLWRRLTLLLLLFCFCFSS